MEIAITEKIKDLKSKGYFIAYLDAINCGNFHTFLVEIGKAFSFPDYYGVNMNALDECINDLDWLNEKNYAIVILNHENLLIKESIENRESIWQFFSDVKKEWQSVPNYEGEDEYRSKADFVTIKA